MTTPGTSSTSSGVRGARVFGPVAAVFVLAAIGWWVYRTVEQSVADELRAHVQADLDATVGWLDSWATAHEERASLVAGDPCFVADILSAAGSAADGGGGLRASLGEQLERMHVRGFLVADLTGRTVAAHADERVGGRTLAERGKPFIAALSGESAVSIAGAPPMVFALAPVRGDDGEVRAVLGLLLGTVEELARPFVSGRSGASRETFAFDADGRLLSPGRFEEEVVRALGGRPDVSLRAPPGVLADRPMSLAEWRELPLTRMATSAISGQSGVDLSGYRSYHGREVVGAWRWHDRLGLGVAIEIEKEHAFGTLSVLRKASWLLLAMLLLAGGAGAVIARHNALLLRKVRKAERAVRQLGQYTLVKKIGEGGMGEVYYARHAMLRRPCAIKLLRPDRTDTRTIDRFEREVQQTSRLTHPNTIQIYDYGRTPGGTFYYVMEYLEGVGLDEFVAEHGPLPEGRVIFILRQICASLNEAHGLGLVHRDIKPANVALCTAGGAYDVVKVLDFGLVMNTAADGNDGSVSGSITGTPAYLAPEAITDPSRVDARSDLYAVGSVGYFLLTGKPVFEGERVIDLINRQVREKPVPPSVRADRAINPDLEQAILACLAKSPAKRPKDANALARELDWCRAASAWNRDKARHWWQDREERMARLHSRGLGESGQTPAGSATVEIDFDAR